MTIEKIQENGATLVYALINGRLHRRRYFGYSERQAKRLFRSEVKEELAREKLRLTNGI